MTNGRSRSGTEEHMLQVARGLSKRDYSVSAIVSPRPDIRWLADELEASGIPVHLVPDRQGTRLGALVRFVRLTRTLHRYRHAILHLQFNGHFSGEMTMLAARVARVGCIVRTEHNPPAGQIARRERVSIFLRDLLLQRIIVISELDRQLYAARLKRDPGKMVVVPHGVDLDLFNRSRVVLSVRHALGIPSDVLVVGNAARLSEDKGTPQFIEMAAALAKRHAAVNFLIAGGGPHLLAYQARVRELGLADRVFFAGDVPRDHMPSYLAAMDVFVLPSLFESGPYSTLEAMAMGVPVVSTAVGMMPQVIENGVSGLLVAPGDVQSLTDGVCGVIRDPTLRMRMASAGQARVVSDYSLERMLDRIEEVYKDACSAVAPL